MNEWFYSPDCRKKEYSIQQKEKKEKEKEYSNYSAIMQVKELKVETSVIEKFLASRSPSRVGSYGGAYVWDELVFYA